MTSQNVPRNKCGDNDKFLMNQRIFVTLVIMNNFYLSLKKKSYFLRHYVPFQLKSYKDKYLLIMGRIKGCVKAKALENSVLIGCRARCKTITKDVTQT